MINVEKIKKSILDLVFKGKMLNVESSKNGTDFLKDIKVSPIEAKDRPYKIPDNWDFANLGDLVKIYTGKKDANFADEKGRYPFYTCASKPTTSNSYSYDGEYLLMPGNGASIGLVFYYYGKFEAYQRTYLLENIKNLNLKYLKYHLEYNWLEFNHNKMHGAATPFIKIANLNEFPIAIPSRGLQDSIVEKLDEIFAELNKIDEKQTKLQSIQDKIESKILKLTIQGKLVEQRPEEGTAEELFEKIQAEKQQLIKQGKIKKEKPLPPIEESEIPFEIPSTWKWVRIGDIFNHSAGKSLNASDTEGKKYTYITTSNVYWNRFILDELKTMFYKDNELEKCSAKKGDLLVLEGGDIGRAAVWNYDYDMRIQNHIHRLRPLNGVDVRFFYYLFFLYKTYNLIDGRGIGLQGLSANKLKSIVMPLPPYEEQKRIVAKIEELLPLCRIIEDE